MRNILLKRNGGRDMVITGRILAQADDSEISDKRPVYDDCLTLWRLTIYETREGDFVLGSEYDSYSPMRVSLKNAQRYRTAMELRLALENDGHTDTELGQLLLNRAAEVCGAFRLHRERPYPGFAPALAGDEPLPELVADCA